jgi:hypothetical protein
MANKDRPSGFRPKGNSYKAIEYTAGARVFPGDAVHMEADGKVDPAVASEALQGVAVSYADAVDDKVLVIDNPDQEFVVQADSADINAQTDMGLNYNIVATAGDTTYNQSRQELDGSSGATDSTLPLRLIRLEPTVDNALGSVAEVVVVINNHQLRKQSEGL